MGFSMQPYGIQSMLKEGHKPLSRLDEAVLMNIDACKQLSNISRTSLGPNGMNKMVINHLDKLFVTNDAITIVNKLVVQHPAAKIEQVEIGDGANLMKKKASCEVSTSTAPPPKKNAKKKSRTRTRATQGRTLV